MKLASRQNNRNNEDTGSSQEESLPPTLFLHGLDSSSHTWRKILNSLESKAVALDLRGCGNSPLGNSKHFSPDAIVNDMHEFLCSHPYFCVKNTNDDTGSGSSQGAIKPFVIVGHSMGGRIAMSFAARYPELIRALVIEDMDVRTRSMDMNPFQAKDRDATVNFNRSLGQISEKDVVGHFEREGYPESSIRKWINEGRVELKDDGSYYSQVNPAFRILCYEQFFITTHGEDMWRELVAECKFRIPTHVMVASKENTVCDEKSLSLMKDTMKKGDKLMTLRRYKDATHSIHNSSQADFLKDLVAILKAASY